MTDLLEYNGKGFDPSSFMGADILFKNSEEADPDPEKIIRSQIERFMDQGGSSSFDGERIGIVINDSDRPTPSHLVITELLDSIPGIEKRLSRVYIATGTHRHSSDQELKHLLGGRYEVLKGRVLVHNCSDEDAHRSYGTTSRGTQVLIQGSLDEHDNLILINSVEPHYFAGFTGGRKSIFPGLSAHGSVEHNHSFALDGGSKALSLEGNPVHEDMEEAADLFMKGRKHVSIQMVQGPGKVLTDVFIGDLKRTFSDAVKLSSELYTIEIPHLYDIVLSIARSPMDRTLYQAQKAIENGKLALKEGGIMILAAFCEEGIGSSAFWDLLSRFGEMEQVLAEIHSGYRLGYHKAAKMVQLAKVSKIFLVSGLSPEMVTKGFMEGFDDPIKALSEAKRRIGGHPSVLIIPDGTVTVPKPRRNTQ